MEHRKSPRRHLLQLAATLGALLLVVFVISGLLGLDAHAVALTWRVRAVLSGSDGPAVTVSGVRDGAWLNDGATVMLSAEDDAVGSGVASITYWLDGVSHTVSADFASVRIPSTDGSHTLAYCATDNAGTTSARQQLTAHVDTVDPVTRTKTVKGIRGGKLWLAYRIVDAASPKATGVTLIVRDAGGDVVHRVALGVRATGVWLRVGWRPATAGVYTYTVTARDLAGRGQRAAEAADIVVSWPEWETIGSSVKGRDITVAHFGTGSRRLLIVGGVHPNETGVAVAEKFIAYLKAHPDAVPKGARIDVIPCLNPDGRVAGTRGNADDVDLNRNFPSSSWRSALSSGDPSAGCGLTGGRSAGSEAETRVLMAYLERGFDVELSLHCDAGILDCHGRGGTALGKRMAALCDLPVGRLTYESKMTGTLEQYVAETYHIPAITVELRDAELRSGLCRALLEAAR